MTDLNGYRSNGGALGQDQGVDPQIERILTSKLPLLNAPGNVLTNALYYDTSTAMVTAVELQNYFAKDRIAANTYVVGASPTFYLPSVLFCGNVYWVCALPDTNYTGGGGISRYTQPHGWGFFAIRNLLVYMGASTVPQLQINSYANFMFAMACCETEGKRLTVLNHAGMAATNRAIQNGHRSPMAEPPLANQQQTKLFRPKTAGDYYAADDVTSSWVDMRYAIVPIRLPWTSMTALDKRLSLDLKLSTQPIQIVIETNPSNQFLCYDRQYWGNVFDTFADSTLQAFQQELSDKSMSVRNELLAMPQFNVSLPFQLPQSIPFTITGPDNGTTAQQFKMNITSLINSDLTTMLFMVVQQAGSAGGRQDYSRTENGPVSPGYGEILESLELDLNGQQIFRYPGNGYDGIIQCLHLDSSKPKITAFTNNTGYRLPSNVYEFNFGRLRSIVSESHMQNTPRFTNQTFQLIFNINRDVNWLNIAADNRVNFVLQMVYCYNSVYLIGGDGGTTKLITN